MWIYIPSHARKEKPIFVKKMNVGDAGNIGTPNGLEDQMLVKRMS
jgi:hypothetical protein